MNRVITPSGYERLVDEEIAALPQANVYFLAVKDLNVIKIGSAGNVAVRVRQLRYTTYRGMDVSLFGSIPGPKVLERQFHYHLERNECRVRFWRGTPREHFVDNDFVRQFIADVIAGKCAKLIRQLLTICVTPTCHISRNKSKCKCGHKIDSSTVLITEPNKNTCGRCIKVIESDAYYDELRRQGVLK